jgi:hypothetical protein
MICSRADLSDPLAFLSAAERRWVDEYDKAQKADQDLPRRESLRHAMHGRRKRIWRAAQKTGWDVVHRRERSRELLYRTR